MDLLKSPQPSLLDSAWQVVQVPYDLVRGPVNAIRSIPTAIPALSIFLIPTFSSWSTSFNVLFFYVTWSTLILAHPSPKVEFWGTLGTRVVFYILPSLSFLLFDSAVPSLAVKIKEHGDIALPLSEEQGGKKGPWWKVALVSIGNVLLGVALQTAIEYLFVEVLHVRSALKITSTIPMPWGIAKDLFRGLLFREILTYLLHRYALHSPSSPLTHMHVDWYHALPAPYSLAAAYDHPFAYLAHVFLPTYVPAVFFRFHLLTYQIYLALLSLEETFAYSGYNMLPGGFILGGIARRQERHLMDGSEGNYSCWGLADLCAGTSLGGDVVEDVVDESEKKRVAERMGEKTKGKGKGSGSKKKKQ
ncbi:hypothetical protein MMC13_004288 [Lambiella insularis]|nr:hypothetical protein [Lambiella insularis]